MKLIRTAIFIYSGALVVYYLFIRPQTHFGS
jgi:hypothetical protein